MRVLWTILLCFLLSGVFFYNSNWFQSFFLYENFYEPIFDAPFDVTKAGQHLSIPIHYKYRTCYGLVITVPDKDLYYAESFNTGILKYRFISNGRVLSQGYTHHSSDRNRMSYMGLTSIYLLVFDLPFPAAGEHVTLDLEIHEPFAALKPFAGKINCRILPDYSAKHGNCLHENLKIVP